MQRHFNSILSAVYLSASAAIACVLATAVYAGDPTCPQAGVVLDEQKISALEGNFDADLEISDNFGAAVANLGDLDGDQISDFAVGVRRDDDGGENRGAVWVLFMNPDGTVRDEQKISDTRGGFQGRLDDNDGFGHALATLGDLNRDGVIDLAVGVFTDGDGGPTRGAVWILFLNSDGTVQDEQKISDLEGGLKATLNDADAFGFSVAGIGDFDGDNVVDLAVGAILDDDGVEQSGAIYILFLHPDGTVKSEQKISTTAGGFGPVREVLDAFGTSVTRLDDLDGNGVNDLAVGEAFDDRNGPGRGALWVLFLNADATVSNKQKISETEGGFTGQLDDSDQFGSSVTSLGDLDGDTINDLAIGTSLDDDGAENSGAVWILFLNPDGTVKNEQKISATQGGFQGNLAFGDKFGSSVTSLQDFNGDGNIDLFVGASGADDGTLNVGAVWLLYLNDFTNLKTRSGADLVLSSQKISATHGGLTGLLNEYDLFGSSIANLGDLDGDGVNDIAVGASWDDNDRQTYTGAVWVLFLNPDATVKEKVKIAEGENGFEGQLNLLDRFGESVADIGDLDGDGVTDIAVGATRDDDGGDDQDADNGAVWVLFLNPDGSVKNQQKISDTRGGLESEFNQLFGSSITLLGDFDEDGVNDIAVGGIRIADGQFASGTIWLLFLNPDGTVKDQLIISQNEGGFDGELTTGDFFGSSVTTLGDLDGDGMTDLAVGAKFSDDGGDEPIANRGAVWILFLNADGTVKDQQKISDTEGGFSGQLNDDDEFATSIADLGDLDGDGVADLVVGSRQSNPVDNGRGAVWVLFLNPDGTVKAELEISDAQGGFSGQIDEFEYFGSGLAVLGDLDGEDHIEVAVGANGDADGGISAGAVWILTLNDCFGPPCPGDLNGDNVVDGADLGLLLSAFETFDSVADLNDDGVINSADLSILLSQFGPCP